LLKFHTRFPAVSDSANADSALSPKKLMLQQPISDTADVHILEYLCKDEKMEIF
jgi:hypothetical protein